MAYDSPSARIVGNEIVLTEQVDAAVGVSGRLLISGSVLYLDSGGEIAAV